MCFISNQAPLGMTISSSPESQIRQRIVEKEVLVERVVNSGGRCFFLGRQEGGVIGDIP